MTQLFGDLRSAVARRSFEDVCACIERWPADAPELHELAIPYALEHVSSWPGPRRAPDRWCDAVYAGARPPWRALADSWSYRSRAFFDGAPHGSHEEPAPTLGEVLAAHDHGLRALSLQGSELTDASWQALRYALHLSSLERLDLWGVGLSDDALRALGRAPFLTTLKNLVLGGRPTHMPGREATRAFFTSHDWRALESLGLSDFTLDVPLEVGSPRALWVHMCRVSPAALASMCGPELERLVCHICWGLDREAAERVASSDTPALHTLCVKDIPLRPRAVDALLSGEHIRRVRTLDLSGAHYVMTGGTSDLAAAVARSCGRLERLSLVNCQLGDDAVDALANSPSAATLAHVDVSKNALGERALQVLASGAFPRLTSLDLSGTGVRGLSTLHAGLRRGALPELERVTISPAQVEGGCSVRDEVAAMRELGVKLDPGVGFMRP